MHGLPSLVLDSPLIAMVIWAAILIGLAAVLPSTKILNHIEEFIIAALMGAATLLIFVAVAQRYSMSMAISLANWGKAQGFDWLFQTCRSLFIFLKSFSFTWAQELCIYMFVWMAKFGAAFGVRTGHPRRR